MIGWQDGASFLDQSQSAVKQTQNELGLLLTLHTYFRQRRLLYIFLRTSQMIYRKVLSASIYDYSKVMLLTKWHGKSRLVEFVRLLVKVLLHLISLPMVNWYLYKKRGDLIQLSLPEFFRFLMWMPELKEVTESLV